MWALPLAPDTPTLQPTNQPPSSHNPPHTTTQYEAMGSMWSMGQIPKVKNGALCAPYVFPGARVLIIGAGHGTDAIYCARNFPDVEVTALDLSPTMLAQLDNRRKKQIPQATNLKLVRAGGRPCSAGRRASVLE